MTIYTFAPIKANLANTANTRFHGDNKSSNLFGDTNP